MKKEVKNIYLSILDKNNIKTKIEQRGIALRIEEFFISDQTMLCNVSSFYVGDREIFPSMQITIEDFDEVIERFDR